MASWQVIEFAGATLVKLIERRAAQLLEGTVVNVQQATAANFNRFTTIETPTITLFLYQIVENPQMRNGQQRTLPDGSRARQPLPLELCYMVTAWGVRGQDSPETDAAAAAEEQRLLGMVLQAFYDNAEIGRADLVDEGARGPVWTPIDSMQIVLDSLPIEDQYRIWDSGESPYRLSLAYRVRIMGLEPLDKLSSSRVVDAGFTVGSL